MRRLGNPTVWLGLVVLAGALALGGSALAGVPPQQGTPAAASPVATAAPTDVVTVVAWYGLDPSGAFLSLLPVATGQGQVVSADTAASSIGQVDFPENGDLPSITLGDTTFNAYLRYEGDVNNGQRWTWFNDEEGARPATLVIQVDGAGGAYQGFFGTATFVSRDEGSAGGVLVLALRPPIPAEGAAAAAPAATVAPTPPPPTTVPPTAVPPTATPAETATSEPEDEQSPVAEDDSTEDLPTVVVDEDETPTEEPS